MQLSKRLAAVAAFIPSGCVVADIGTDHADLPIYLVKNKICPRVIAVENKRGPWLRARANIESCGLQGYIDLRLGDGLQVLRPGEAQVLVLAGIGCLTIQQVLAAGQDVWWSAHRLVIQPQNKWQELRLWLSAAGWRLTGEDLIYEGRHFYAVMALEPGPSPPYSSLEWELGPLLVARRHPLLLALVEKKIKKLEIIKRNLAGSHRPSLNDRVQEIGEKLLQLEEIRQWLQNARKS
ncbi:MAG: tRNA (adenine22-N1)-methyltransferase [Clostridia bacterium]|nr:tRNA (adenine22-N1)-methyltransferase [Clostridia bacterium]